MNTAFIKNSRASGRAYKKEAFSANYYFVCVAAGLAHVLQIYFCDWQPVKLIWRRFSFCADADGWFE